MLNKVGIPMLMLAAMLFVLPAKQAQAGAHFGVYLGAPAYVAPAPMYPPPYVAPAPNYYDPYPYGYVAPTYVYPYANWGWGGGWHGREHWNGRGYYGGGDRGFGHGSFSRGGFAHGGGHGGRR